MSPEPKPSAQPKHPLDYRVEARALVARMTLEEKASLCSGRDFWSSKPVERLGLASMCLTDGPHGVRKAADTDFTNSLPATCFPTAVALSSSWNAPLVEQVGAALGREAQAQGVQILLGPGVNLKRSPLCGRNFEYFSEDPVLAGKLAAAHIRGVQSQGVGASVKHFAANNQEYERLTTDSCIDPRTLHEIYLTPFEIAVREAQPWTVMCAYNRINGTFASEHRPLLHETLKERWGFFGLVVSDWGAVGDRVAGANAGLHLEMPASGGRNDARLVEAVHAGELDEARLSALVEEIVSVTLCALDQHRPGARFDPEAHHELARKVAAEGAVLLKNERLWPLNPERPLRVAVVGAFAGAPRYQGAGSSQVRPTQLSSVADALKGQPHWTVHYARGYDSEGDTSEALLAEARKVAAAADVAVVLAGLPDSYESEGFDRRHLDLPEGHNRLVEAVAAVQPHTGVVLMNGAAVCLPWADQVSAILEAWLGGQAGGLAIVDLLTGRTNPSGKLSETFPARLEDTPAFNDFPGREGQARYGERLFVGYRHYDRSRRKPAFPFGHGLSYTQFGFESLQVQPPSPEQAARGVLQVAEVEVRNRGDRAGQEVVQVYVSAKAPRVQRPEQELKHFSKLELAPGESKKACFELGERDFAHYDPRVGTWVVDSGPFELRIGNSSANTPLRHTVLIEQPRPYPALDQSLMLKEVAEQPGGAAPVAALLKQLVAVLTGTASQDKETPEQRKAREMAEAFWSELPLWKVPLMAQGKVGEAAIRQLLEEVQAAQLA